jgi:hypothetical protein
LEKTRIPEMLRNWVRVGCWDARQIGDLMDPPVSVEAMQQMRERAERRGLVAPGASMPAVREVSDG